MIRLAITRLPTATPNALSNAVSVVSQAVSVATAARVAGDAAELSNRLSADVALSLAIDAVSNAVSGETLNRVSADALLSAAQTILSNALSLEGADRLSADGVISAAQTVISNAASVVSNAASVVSQALSVVSAAAVFLGPQKAINTADQAQISASATVTISGVSVALTAGRGYFFRFLIPFTSSATTGITLGVTGPAVNSLCALTEIPLGGTAQATTYAYGKIAAQGGKVSTASNSLSGVTLLAMIEGHINPSANGSLKALIGPTVRLNPGGVVPKKGAMVLVWRMV